MKVIAILTDFSVVDRIIDQIKLTFVAERATPSQVFERVALMAAEESWEYELRVISRGEAVCCCLGDFSVALVSIKNVLNHHLGIHISTERRNDQSGHQQNTNIHQKPGRHPAYQ
jgi:hypothetical protein